MLHVARRRRGRLKALARPSRVGAGAAVAGADPRARRRAHCRSAACGAARRRSRLRRRRDHRGHRPERRRQELAHQCDQRASTARQRARRIKRRDLRARADGASLAALGVARTFQNIWRCSRALSVSTTSPSGLAGAARATFVEQILGLGRARRRGRPKCADARDEVIELPRSRCGDATASSARCPTACRSASNSRARWSPRRSSCCSTSRWPA